MPGVRFAVSFKLVVPAERFHQRVGQDGELLVGVRVAREGKARLGYRPLHPHPQPVGARAELEVEAVLEEAFKLDAEQPPLGEHAAPLLDEVAEIGLQRVVHDDDRLAEERPALGPAEVEDVAQPREVGQGEVVRLCGERPPESRAPSRKR